MAKFNDKISTLINSQLPDFVVDEHPQFVQFLKTYFQFMESAELQITSIQSTDGITLENETGTSSNLLLDGSKISSERTQLDQGDKIIYEDTSYGKFTVGETITGYTSKATAKVLAEDISKNRIFITSQDKFHKDEYKVEGCVSEVFLVPNKNNNILNFQADSNSVITRGLIAMLLRIYSDRKPEDILNNPPEFIDKVGLGVHLTPSRTNGLHSMVKKIMEYAKQYSSN